MWTHAHVGLSKDDQPCFDELPVPCISLLAPFDDSWDQWSLTLSTRAAFPRGVMPFKAHDPAVVSIPRLG